MNVIDIRTADRRPAHGGYPDPPSAGQYEPCPFCVGEFPIIPTRDHAGHVVICTSCSAMGPTCLTQEAAITAWNRRSGNSPQAAEAIL